MLPICRVCGLCLDWWAAEVAAAKLAALLVMPSEGDGWAPELTPVTRQSHQKCARSNEQWVIHFRVIMAQSVGMVIVHGHASALVLVRAHVRVHVHVHVCVHLHVHIQVLVHVQIYVHIHTHVDFLILTTARKKNSFSYWRPQNF